MTGHGTPCIGRAICAESRAALFNALNARDPAITDLRAQYCILDQGDYGPQTCELLTKASVENTHIKTLKFADFPPSACSALGKALELGMHLTSLTVHEACGIMHDQAGVAIANGLLHNTHLGTLKLQGAFGPMTGLALSRVLSQNKTLKSLALVGKFVTEIDGAIGQGLKRNNTLQSLRLVESGECPGTGVMVAEALRHNTSVKSVLIACKGGGTATVSAMAQTLEVNTSLQTVAIVCAHTSSEAGVALRKVLETNSTLTSLRLCSNEMGSEFATTIVRALRHNKTLKSLSLECFALGKHSLGSSVCVAVAEVLRENSTLRTLKLAGDFKDEAAIVMAQELRRNRSLQTLALLPQHISQEVGEALGQMLEHNTALVSFTLGALRMHADCAHDATGVAVARALQVNTALKALKLAASLGPNGTPALAKALEVNKTLKSFALNSDRFVSNSGAEFASALKKNNTLRGFSLECHNARAEELNDDTGMAVAEALRENKSVRALHLHCRALTRTTGKALADALETNVTLRSLRLFLDFDSCLSTRESLAKALDKNLTLRRQQVNHIEALHPMGLTAPCDLDTAKALQRNQMHALKMGILAPVARTAYYPGFLCLQQTCLRRKVFEFLLPESMVEELFTQRPFIGCRPSTKEACTATAAEPAPTPAAASGTGTMDSLPAFAARGAGTMDSLPSTFWNGNHLAMRTFDSLPSLAQVGPTWRTMDSLPTRGVNTMDSLPTHGANTMDSLPSLPETFALNSNMAQTEEPPSPYNFLLARTMQVLSAFQPTARTMNVLPSFQEEQERPTSLAQQARSLDALPSASRLEDSSPIVSATASTRSNAAWRREESGSTAASSSSGSSHPSQAPSGGFFPQRPSQECDARRLLQVKIDAFEADHGMALGHRASAPPSLGNASDHEEADTYLECKRYPSNGTWSPCADVRSGAGRGLMTFGQVKTLPV